MKKRSFLSCLLLAVLAAVGTYLICRNRYAILERLTVWKHQILRALHLEQREEDDYETF